MKIFHTRFLFLALSTGFLAGTANAAAAGGRRGDEIDKGKSGTIRFFGARSAELFTREVAESFRGALGKDCFSQASGNMPRGFVQASPTGQDWCGTMWTRDGGTFMRELVQWGYLEHAVLLSDCLIDLVRKNEDGYFSFPEYFEGSKPGIGMELDGTAAIVIGMAGLWERLSNDDPARKRIHDFLSGPASPVAFIRRRLEKQPLIAGTGEFGPGCGLGGEAVNVVQNGLVALALRAASNVCEGSGDLKEARTLRGLAKKVADAMLVKPRRCRRTLDLVRRPCHVEARPGDRRPRNQPRLRRIERCVKHAGGRVGIRADRGKDPLILVLLRRRSNRSTTPSSQAAIRQIRHVDAVRRVSSGPELTFVWPGLRSPRRCSLFDRLDLADKGLNWLAVATHELLPGYNLPRESPYFFHEQMFSPTPSANYPWMSDAERSTWSTSPSRLRSRVSCWASTTRRR